MALTKADMAERLFEELGLNKREAKELVEGANAPTLGFPTYKKAGKLSLGFSASAAAEFEFFLFEETPGSLQDRDFRSPAPMTRSTR
mgnify:CR=1 FL=1